MICANIIHDSDYAQLTDLVYWALFLILSLAASNISFFLLSTSNRSKFFASGSSGGASMMGGGTNDTNLIPANIDIVTIPRTILYS